MKKDRGDIETKEQFIERNIKWWKTNEKHERETRKHYYDDFVQRHNIPKSFFGTVGEVGPGPFGGVLEVCDIKANKKVFIDYIMDELKKLNFISWPMEAEYYTCPVEDLSMIPDNHIDLLISYNAVDHGWDIWKGLRECLRISKSFVVNFDCRGDTDTGREKLDLDHFQRICARDSISFFESFRIPFVFKHFKGVPDSVEFYVEDCSSVRTK